MNLIQNDKERIILLIFAEIFLCSKYPEISCVEDREKYKAVFNDQYQEYKDLHRDISTTMDKFRELDATMAKLLRDGKSQRVRHKTHYRKYKSYLKPFRLAKMHSV